MRDHVTDGPAGELRYRDGDDVEPHDVRGTYFTPAADWPDDWTRRLAVLPGPVVDVGCGAGQHARWLQDRGREVVAVDASPNAVAAARDRGVEDVREHDMFDLALPRDRFRSALVVGTQAGLAGSLAGVRAFLADLGRVTAPDGIAVVDSYDPGGLDPATFLGYRPDPRAGVARRTFHFEYEGPDGGREVGRSLSFVLFGPDRLRDVLVGTPWELDAVWPQEGYYRAKLAKGPGR